MSTATMTRPDVATADDALVGFHDVGMTYAGGTVALEHVDITVNRGEFVTVVGPSGCGKSTLLRIAAGLEENTAGTCETRTDRVGFVFQDATLLPWRNVRKNVELLAELGGLPAAERAAAAKTAIDLVGLRGFETSMPRQLSGGMRMRASLARSLTLDPDLFLFDEPFGALDEITRQRLNDELLRLFAQRGFGGLFITHSVSEAVYLSTKVVVMSGRPGRIVDVVDVPFDMPRDPEIRFSPEFGDLVGRVSHSLKEAHA